MRAVKKIFLVPKPNADTIEICRDLLHLWSRIYRAATLSRGNTTWCQTLVIKLDARFVRLQKSNHAEAKDASSIIIMYRLRGSFLRAK